MKTLHQQIADEWVSDIQEYPSTQNNSKAIKRSWRNRIEYLLDRARPNNWAWNELVNKFGFEGDYQELDSGNEPELIK